jgi:glycosyltransferase involved in cell wall biosynthesis
MTLARPGEAVELSLLVPAKDEAENLPEFVRLCATALAPLPYACELIVVNDGSRDATGQVLEELAGHYPFLRMVTHRSQRGIADALRSAGDVANGRIFVFYPADLQFLPAEVPTLVEPIRRGEADIVTGAKQGNYDKAFVSGIYNRLCRWLFGVRVTDLNAVKAYRREVMDVVPARPDWHRFMVVIAAAEGFQVAERPVTLYARRAGKSKFGLGRIPVGVFDLVSVWFQLRFGRKPMLFFGLWGALLVALGVAVGIVAIVLRFGFNEGFRPLLYAVMLLVISGVVLFGVGFLGETVAGSREETRALARAVQQLARELDRVSHALSRRGD